MLASLKLPRATCQPGTALRPGKLAKKYGAVKIKVFSPQLRSVVAFCTNSGTQSDVKINIEGMMCDGCSSRIENVLKGMESVKTVSVSLEGKVATVRLAKEAASVAEAQAAAAALVDTINGLGFEAKLGA